MTQAPLTRRQKEILDFFRDYCDREGISPTLEEIAEHFGVNKVTVFGHVAELERKGVLRRRARGVSRGLQLVDPGGTSAGSRPGAPGSAGVGSALPAVSAGRTLQILGSIAAGAPIETIEAPEELNLADILPPDREVYALRVRGNSMIDDAIADGDIVLVERREQAHNGETVVAVLPEGEATLKRFYREKGRIRLQPANSELDPLYCDDVRIRGVVIGVLRRF